MTRSLKRQQRLRGMTLIELTTSLGIGLVILGVIYLIYEQTQKTADRQRIEAQVLMEASQLSDRINSLIENACRPGSLVNEAGELTPERFLSNQLEIYALSTTSGEGPQLVSIKDDETSQTVSISSDTKRSYQDLFDTSIKFQYASAFDEQLEPLNLTAETSSRPSYIRYTITIRDKKKLMAEALTITSGAALK